ncbi:MAG TPA: hypothetical protein PKN81_03750, partial [Anaerolineales bacterium]|nr:hypothetical protein [Anaerolineales bacterium]
AGAQAARIMLKTTSRLNNAYNFFSFILFSPWFGFEQMKLHTMEDLQPTTSFVFYSADRMGGGVQCVILKSASPVKERYAFVRRRLPAKLELMIRIPAATVMHLHKHLCQYT